MNLLVLSILVDLVSYIVYVLCMCYYCCVNSAHCIMQPDYSLKEQDLECDTTLGLNVHTWNVHTCGNHEGKFNDLSWVYSLTCLF